MLSSRRKPPCYHFSVRAFPSGTAVRLCAICITVALFAGLPSQGVVQPTGTAITVERFSCFETCPAYLLRIDSSGTDPKVAERYLQAESILEQAAKSSSR